MFHLLCGSTLCVCSAVLNAFIYVVARPLPKAVKEARFFAVLKNFSYPNQENDRIAVAVCDYISKSVYESGHVSARRGWEDLSTRLESSAEPAKPANAESIVLALRNELRKRNDFEQQGETLKAHRANERAGRKMRTLGAKMKYRFGLLAEATFGRDNAPLVEETVEDIVGQLYEDLQDLGSSSKSQYYEVAFARRASLTAHDVIRRVKKRYGMRANKKDKHRDHIPQSI
jgi:hypothetical protein